MKKLILVCLIVLLGCFACTPATKTTVLKPGMPNTVKLSNGEVVYDLRGEWDISTTRSSVYRYGLLEIAQNEDRFVGTLKSGNYNVGPEMVKGRLKGGEVVNLQFNTLWGWINSSGYIEEGGKMMTIHSQVPEFGSCESTLRKK